MITLVYFKGKGIPELQNPLHIEKPMGDTMPHIPKGVYKWSLHNPNSWIPKLLDCRIFGPGTMHYVRFRSTPKFPYAMECIVV
jgi:hypothetical protein